MGGSSVSKIWKRQGKNVSMRIERRKGVIRGEAIVGGNQKLTRGRFVVEFFCLVPVLVGPFLNQLGFVGVQEGFFSEEGPKIRWCGSSILCGGRHKSQPRQ